MTAAKLRVQFEIQRHGPQWQRRMRIWMNDGHAGTLRVHGTMYVSERTVGVLQALLLRPDSGADITFVWVDDLPNG